MSVDIEHWVIYDVTIPAIPEVELPKSHIHMEAGDDGFVRIEVTEMQGDLDVKRDRVTLFPDMVAAIRKLPEHPMERPRERATTNPPGTCTGYLGCFCGNPGPWCGDWKADEAVSRKVLPTPERVCDGCGAAVLPGQVNCFSCYVADHY